MKHRKRKEKTRRLKRYIDASAGKRKITRRDFLLQEKELSKLNLFS